MGQLVVAFDTAAIAVGLREAGQVLCSRPRVGVGTESSESFRLNNGCSAASLSLDLMVELGYPFGPYRHQADASSLSILLMHSLMACWQRSIKAGISSRLMPAVGMAGSERIMMRPLFQRFRRMAWL